MPYCIHFDREPMRGSPAGMTVATAGGRPITSGTSSSTRNAMPDQAAMNCAAAVRAMPLEHFWNLDGDGARLYLARIEDLGRSDLVQVDCAAYHPVALVTPEFLLRLGLSRQAKILDLKARVRCRGAE